MQVSCNSRFGAKGYICRANMRIEIILTSVQSRIDCGRPQKNEYKFHWNNY